MTEEEFSIDKLNSFFKASMDNPKISLREYIDGYDQVYKFLNLLGTVFGWVGSDIQAKMNVIKELMDGAKSENYTTVHDMIEYETSAGLIMWKKSTDGSGSRNFLILHRALEYVVAFLNQMEEIEENEKCSNISKHAYESTLMKHHPWLVQKAAKLAMNLLPTKRAIVLKVAQDESEKAINEVYSKFPKAVESMKIAYEKAEVLCGNYNLQSLKVE